jgi:hypothetical protein
MFGTKKLWGMIVATSVIFYAGCSSDGDPASTENAPTEVDYKVSACAIVSDSEVQAELNEATNSSIGIFQALANGDFEGAKEVSAYTKSTFKTILTENPKNCGAQLGYAVTIISDLVNNKEINDLYNRVTSEEPSTLLNVDPESYSKILMKTSVLAKSSEQPLITDQVQSAIATGVLPAVDSAIILLRNITNTEDFSFTFTVEGKTIELDKGEFAPALGVLHFAKAYLIAAASINIDASKDKSYQWALTLSDLNSSDFENLSTEQRAALDHVTGLLSSKSPFTTVRNGWESSWKSIPALLDTAISNVQEGLEYGIEEYNDPKNSQENDLYVVGLDEEADVSPQDLQEAIENMEMIKGFLRGPIEIDINDSLSITVNISKFFTITDGFQDFLPYYKLTDYSTWMTPPPEVMVWEEEIYWELERSAAAYEIADVVKELYNGDVVDLWEESDAYYVYLYTSDYEYNRVPVYIDGCSYTIGDVAHQLSTTSCKDSNGTVMYQNFNSTLPNILVFTDAAGKETLPAYKLTLPKNEDGDRWTISDMKGIIVFPDPSFNGVFPKMKTQDDIWNLIEKIYYLETSYEDEEDYLYY